jgi:hypothetical protein
MWLTVVLILFIVFLLTVIGFLSKALMVQVQKNNIYSQWIVELQNKVEEIYRTMHLLDDKQMFSKDDEVGSVFQQMVKLIDSLNEKITKE